MEPTKYWKGIEELNKDAVFIEQKQKEFAEEIPVENIIADTLTKKTAGRRDFLKMMGFSVTAATVAASCRIPVKKVIPYAIKPEEITPGIANYYASTYADGTEYCSILVKVRDGRPIKIEGNTNSPITRGGTSARVQASLLSLYDKNRPQTPKKSGVNIEWEKLDAEVKEQLDRVRTAGGQIRILSSTIISPSTRAVIADFMRAYPNTRHVVYEPMSYSAVADAHEQSHGKRVVPGYNFDKANVIVGFSCDFLGTWLSPVEFAKQYITNRKVSKENPKMSRHIHFESRLSLTGSNADTRVPLKPSDEKKALVALYNRITGASVSVKLPSNAEAAVNRAADELLANRGNALVVSGLNDVNCQVLVNAINSALGSYGSTIDTARTTQAGQANDKAVMELVGEMNAGNIGALIVYNANPVYSIAGFGEALKKVPTSIAISDKRTETANLCTYVAPDHHYLESWNDAEPRVGSYSLAQPTISPIFNTRQAQDSLLIWSGSTVPYQQYLQQRWSTSMYGAATGFATATDFWNDVLRNGLFNGSSVAPVTVAAATAVTSQADRPAVAATPPPVTSSVDASSAASTLASAASNGMELVLYEKVGLGNGKYANNPWLQELPDPVTKATWDNYACLPVLYANEQGIANGDVITLKSGNTEVSLPVIVQPGQPNGTVAVAVGYGRTDVGPAGNNVGRNVYPMAMFDGRSFQHTGMAATIGKTGDKIKMAQTQTHHTIEGRDIIKETTLAQYAKDPMAGNHERKKFAEINETTLYPRHKFAVEGSNLRWFMNIDLSSCIGCGACAIACHTENNVPVVGKNEVARVHEMHWIRIDRYYSFNNPNSTKLEDRVTKEEKDNAYTNPDVKDYENVNVTYQPMLCQHCENAPCENVCPVAATNHSSEGLNQMAYNRCVGTRYCANNCPYKVRRFNWFDYTMADSFPANTAVETERIGMLDDLTRMVLNPDVTVRSRGVMEKCTFCVQRLQEGKLQAKKEERPIKDGEVTTACAQACPTNAIVFGNIHDGNSQVRKLNDDERTFYVLQEIHTMPSIGYMTKVRNIQENNNA